MGTSDQIQSEQFSRYHNIPLYILSSSTNKVDERGPVNIQLLKRILLQTIKQCVDIVEILNLLYNQKIF
jgi:hypothetical protein